MLGTLAATAVPAAGQSGHNRVLLLFDEDRSLPGLSVVDQAIRSTLSAGLGDDVEFFTESMHAAQFPEEQHALALRDYYMKTYGARKLDLIVGVMGPAVTFLRKHGDAFAPGVPIVFCGADASDLDGVTLPARMTGLLVRRVFAPTLDIALRLQPDTRQIFVVGGTSEFDRHLQAAARREFEPFERRVSFAYLTDLPMKDLLTAVSQVPPKSFVVYLTVFRDGVGQTFVPHDVVSRISAVASAPVYVFVDQYLGNGPIGGYLYSTQLHGKATGELGLRVLRGESPASIPVRGVEDNQYMFDIRQLNRWSLDSRLLPVASVILFREPSVWDRYGSYILSALALLTVQSLLIVGLLYQLRARRRAEIQSRRNLALAADAGRRQTMSALTSSIAHELIQPLSSMIHNARAGRTMITGNPATLDTIGEILSDIESEGVQATQIIDRHRAMLRSHQLDKKPIDLHAVIHESLALVAHEMRARQVDATLNLSSNPCIITGDQVLLQQVLVNLVMNAMDAMAEMPSARRSVTIRTEIRAANVEVSVRDTGSGLPAHVANKMFTSFVTTKAHGLGIGLTIARTIIDAHGGTIDARNNPEGGATFTVTLRRGEAPKILSSPPSAA